MARRKPSYPADTNASNISPSSISPTVPLELTGNGNNIPDLLELWKTGAVSESGNSNLTVVGGLPTRKSKSLYKFSQLFNGGVNYEYDGTGTPEKFRLTEAMSVMLTIRNITVGTIRYLFGCTAGGVDTDPANNYLWSLNITADGRLRYSHEYGAGTNFEFASEPIFSEGVSEEVDIGFIREGNEGNVILLVGGYETARGTIGAGQGCVGGGNTQLTVGTYSTGTPGNYPNAEIGAKAIWDVALSTAQYLAAARKVIPAAISY